MGYLDCCIAKKAFFCFHFCSWFQAKQWKQLELWEIMNLNQDTNPDQLQMITLPPQQIWDLLCVWPFVLFSRIYHTWFKAWFFIHFIKSGDTQFFSLKTNCSGGWSPQRIPSDFLNISEISVLYTELQTLLQGNTILKQWLDSLQNAHFLLMGQRITEKTYEGKLQVCKTCQDLSVWDPSNFNIETYSLCLY